MPKSAIIPIQRRRPEPPPASRLTSERFLSLKVVLARLTISRSLLYELIKDPIRPFRAPVHIGRRSVRVEGEVVGYMRAVVEGERG